MIGLGKALASLQILSCLAVPSIKILVLREEQPFEGLDGTLLSLPSTYIKVSELNVVLKRNDPESSWNNVCTALKEGVFLIVDLTWTSWPEVGSLAERGGIPYLWVDLTMRPLFDVVTQIVQVLRQTVDVALIFQRTDHYLQSLFLLSQRPRLHVYAVDQPSFNTTVMQMMTPIPSVYFIFADTNDMRQIFQVAEEADLAQMDDRWHFVFTDLQSSSFKPDFVDFRVALVSMNRTLCCDQTQDKPGNCSLFVELLFISQLELCLGEVLKKQLEYNDFVPFDCSINTSSTSNMFSGFFFNENFMKVSAQYTLLRFIESEKRVTLDVDMIINATKKGEENIVGRWSPKTGLFWPTQMKRIKRFFRVGTGYTDPFAYNKIDQATGKDLLDQDGKYILEGFCIDFIHRLAQDMNFDYDIKANKVFGESLPNDTWNGLVGELAAGVLDIVVAPLTMTSEREEVIDFVTPFFTQSGFSIAMRKPLREISLFKFTAVFDATVWFVILGVLIGTGILLWFLEKYSPYSTRNNKRYFCYNCRQFTLKESFWFSVTSFTPAGGGETPKSLAGRVLVTAYWIFVVLMLATFTANLAAVLTVERMQSSIQSLEQLSKQSSIKYTVVNNSDVHDYFVNMKKAEAELFNMWNNKTVLASQTDLPEYRVWDYPIKERYGHILDAILSAGLVNSADEGFDRILASNVPDFAFIHDALEIRYKVYRNCYLVEVGNTFAQQPYSVAVQKGSHLTEELSRKIMQLEKEKYFERLMEKYWNKSNRGRCNVVYENEGTTLESLGGVFIVTFVGLVSAVITLWVEVTSSKKNKLGPIRSSSEPPMSATGAFYKEILTDREFGLSKRMSNNTLLVTNVKDEKIGNLWQFY